MSVDKISTSSGIGIGVMGGGEKEGRVRGADE